MTARLVGVEQQEPAGGGLDGLLHEAVGIVRRLGKGGPEIAPVVVVADQEMPGHRELVQDGAQRGIGGRIAAVGEVARDDTTGRVPMVGVDVGHTGFEPGPGIEPEQGRAGRHHMGVGDLDNLHGAAGPLDDQQDVSGTVPEPRHRASFG